MRSTAKIMRRRWLRSERVWSTGGTVVVGENQSTRGKERAPVPLHPAQIPHGLAWGQMPVSAVRDRQVTAWATARPSYVRSRGNCHRQHRSEHKRQTVLITSSSILLRSQCISVDGSMIDEGWWVGRDLKESGYSIVEVFAWSDQKKKRSNVPNGGTKITVSYDVTSCNHSKLPTLLKERTACSVPWGWRQ